jgi:hypothetical protein
VRQSSVVIVIAAVAAWCSALFTGTSAAAARMPALAGTGAGMADTARWVAGSAAFSPAWISSVSCASAGNCSAGGLYADRSGAEEALVVSETNGAWGRAHVVFPGRVPAPMQADTASVSCPSAGNCAGGGYYSSGENSYAFVVSEKNGIWGKGKLVPGLAALNKSEDAVISLVSCGSPGNCSAGGYYTDVSGHQQAFVASEENGRWDRAREVPGLAAVNKGGYATVGSLSCASAGTCSAGGYYTDIRGTSHAFAVGETDGTWGTAVKILGLAGPSKGGYGAIVSLSCASPDDCSAGGYYANKSGGQAFVVSEKDGSWGKAELVPGLARLHEDLAGIGSLSCASPGNCGAGGGYGFVYYGRGYALVVSQKRGSWNTAQKLPDPRS